MIQCIKGVDIILQCIAAYYSV